MFIYLYFMRLHVGKDTTHLQYCATASWHWQMTNPPFTSLQKIMYTKCTFACKDLFVQIKNKVLKWTQSDIHGYPTGNGFILDGIPYQVESMMFDDSSLVPPRCWSVGFKFTSNGPNLHPRPHHPCMVHIPRFTNEKKSTKCIGKTCHNMDPMGMSDVMLQGDKWCTQIHELADTGWSH